MEAKIRALFQAWKEEFLPAGKNWNRWIQSAETGIWESC